MQTRRDILAVAAATVTLPMIDSALGTLKSASAAAPAAAPAAAAAPAVNTPAEKAGWFTTTLKPADVKAGEFTAVPDHKVILVNSDKKIAAYTNICTHRQCAMAPTAAAKTIECSCHKSAFNTDGTVAKGPATKPLDRYSIRVNDKGLIEIDATVPKADAKEFAISVA